MYNVVLAGKRLYISPPAHRLYETFYKRPHLFRRGAVAKAVQLTDAPTFHVNFSSKIGLIRLAGPADKEHHLLAFEVPLIVSIVTHAVVQTLPFREKVQAFLRIYHRKVLVRICLRPPIYALVDGLV